MSDATKTRIDELEAELEQLDAAEAERSAAAAKAARLATLEREVADRKAVAEAEAKHGLDKIAVHHTVGGVVIVKRPEHMLYRRFVNKKDVDADDAHRLVLTCLVYPSRAAFDALSEELPGVPMDVAIKVIDLAQGRARGAAGKS